MKTLGLYAVDPEEGEILFGVTIETTGNCYMPPYNRSTASGAYIRLITTVGNSENVSLQTDAAAIATFGDINELREQFNNKIDKVDGKGLSTNDFTNEYKRQIDFNKASAEYLAAHKANVTDVNGVKADISEINEALDGHTLGKDVPVNADFLDTKVGQYSSDYNADFRLLLSNSANQTSETASTNKSLRLIPQRASLKPLSLPAILTER